MKNLPATERPVASVTMFYTYPELVECVEKVLELDTAMFVEKHNQTFQLAKKTVDTWLKSYTKACADVGGYFEGKKKQAQKDQDQQKKDEERKEIAVA